MRDLLEPMRSVEARGEFVGESLVVNKAVCACRADGLLVKMLGVKYAALDTGDLCADKRSAAFEILRPLYCPALDLPLPPPPTPPIPPPPPRHRTVVHPPPPTPR